jgi:hypothetical protein
MKLRLEGNSIRLRVRKSDISTLQKNETITETLTFPNDTVFQYQLSINNTAIDIDAQLVSNILNISIPLSIATNWIQTDAVGIEKTLPNGLFILIEKDFPCTDRPWEDTSDTFFELVNEKEMVC